MDKVRVGIIGLGNIGKAHYGYMHELEGAELTAICDVDPDRFDLDVEEDFDHDLSGLTKPEDVLKFRDYREMLDSGEVDAVVIATPHYFHPEIAIEAFARDIHVICEKPVAITAREAREINEAWQKSDAVFTIMFQKRTNPGHKKIHELLNDGTVGEIRRINWIITDWFRTQAYYDSGGWRGNWTGEGGGVLMNQCPHELDLFQWHFGLPRKVAGLAYLGKWHDVTIEDDVSVVMEMEDGSTATFVTTTGDHPGTNRLEVTGENGKLVYEEEETLTFYRVESPVQQILEESERGFYRAEPEKVEIEIPDSPSGHLYITQNAVNAVLEGEELIVPGTDGIRSLQLANAMLYAGATGEQVEFPVAEEDYDEFLAELRKDERENHPDKAFDWEEFIRECQKK